MTGRPLRPVLPMGVAFWLWLFAAAGFAVAAAMYADGGFFAFAAVCAGLAVAARR